MVIRPNNYCQKADPFFDKKKKKWTLNQKQRADISLDNYT
jgi:hypothetical protein